MFLKLSVNICNLFRFSLRWTFSRWQCLALYLWYLYLQFVLLTLQFKNKWDDNLSINCCLFFSSSRVWQFFLNWKILSAIWAREEGPCVTWGNELLEFSLQLDPTDPLRIRPWVVSPLWTFTALTFRNWVRAVQTGYFPARTWLLSWNSEQTFIFYLISFK